MPAPYAQLHAGAALPWLLMPVAQAETSRAYAVTHLAKPPCVPSRPRASAGYVKRFLQTQKSTVLDMHRRLEGRHKTGKLIPITIRVTRIESAGEITFLGVLRAVQEDFAECVVAIEDGIMIEANDACAELFGYSSGKELLNHPVASLLQPEAEGDLRAALTIAASGEDVDHQFAGRHASGDGLPVSMQLEIGDDEASCIKIRFTSLAGSGLLTTDGMGNIRSCNQLMSRLFGELRRHRDLGPRCNPHPNVPMMRAPAPGCLLTLNRPI